MDMSCTRHQWGRRQALAAVGALVPGSFVPLPGAARGSATSGLTQGPAVAASVEYRSPVIWQEFANIDVIRIGATYYASASTMHYSPGEPVLRSYDLMNWEITEHSVPTLAFGAKDDLNGGRG